MCLSCTSRVFSLLLVRPVCYERFRFFLQPEVWDDLSSFQQAFSIGNKEAGAAWNLLKHIDGPVVEALMLLVQQLGLRRNGFSSEPFSMIWTMVLSPWFADFGVFV